LNADPTIKTRKAKLNPKFTYETPYYSQDINQTIHQLIRIPLIGNGKNPFSQPS